MSNGNELLPLGYRFYPTEEELLSFYLHNKLSRIREADIERVIPVTNIYRFDPWQLPEISCTRDSEQWFFFCPWQPREAHGGRPTRTTPSGYWKATGSTGPVYASDSRARVLGVKKTMVFYRGRAPGGNKTSWKMNEYRALEGDFLPGSVPRLRNELSLCRVYKNSGTMRSFDRRPFMASTSQNPTTEETTGHSGAERSRSQASSSSDPESSNPPSTEEAELDLKVLDEFDWNQLDWL